MDRSARKSSGGACPAARLAFAALLFYVTLDFANPLMAGAVCFDPERSVEGVARARLSIASIATLPQPTVVPAPAIDDPAPGARVVPAWDLTGARARPRARATLETLSERSLDDH